MKHTIDTPKYLKRRTVTKFDENYILSGNTEITSDKRLIHNPDTAYNTNAGLIFTKRQLTAAEDTGKSITAVLRWKSPGSFNTSFHDYVFACGRGATGGPYPLNLRLYSGEFYMNGGSGSDSYVAVGNKLVTSTWYWIKLVYTKIGTSSAWTSYYCLDNGREPLDNEYTQLLTTNRNWTPLGASSSYPDCDYIRLGIHYTKSGSIGETQYDLTKCYIKVGDEYIYKGQYTDVDYQAGTENDYNLIIPQKHTVNTPKYLKKVVVETAWTQPVLLNGNAQLGGSSFAVSASNTYSGAAWQLFDGSTSTSWDAGSRPSWFTFYNPNPIKVSRIQTYSLYSSWTDTQVTITASNDNSNWETLATITLSQANTQNWDIPDDKQSYYKYYRYTSNSGGASSNSFFEVYITATELTEGWTVGTSSNYNLIIPQKYTVNKPKYLKKIITETPFVQPILSANGTIGGDSFAVEKVGNSYNGDAYQTFDGSTSTAFRPYVNNGLIFYNPKPINITNLACNVAYSNEGILKGELYASNDNSTWNLINDNIGGAQTWSTDINMQGSYKYFKLISTSVTGGRGSVAELIITATEYVESWQQGTPQDYDIIM